MKTYCTLNIINTFLQTCSNDIKSNVTKYDWKPHWPQLKYFENRNQHPSVKMTKKVYIEAKYITMYMKNNVSYVTVVTELTLFHRQHQCLSPVHHAIHNNVMKLSEPTFTILYVLYITIIHRHQYYFFSPDVEECFALFMTAS